MKFRNQTMIGIVPTHVRTGNTAPKFFIEAVKNEAPSDTDARARAESRLGSFKEWRFFDKKRRK